MIIIFNNNYNNKLNNNNNNSNNNNNTIYSTCFQVLPSSCLSTRLTIMEIIIINYV